MVIDLEGVYKLLFRCSLAWWNDRAIFIETNLELESEQSAATCLVHLVLSMFSHYSLLSIELRMYKKHTDTGEQLEFFSSEP